MLTNKTVSVKNIIAKVYRDLQLKEEEPFTDFIEHCAEALEFIHVYPQFDHKQLSLSIKNYKAELPCDYISLEAVSYEGHNLRYTTNMFGPLDTTRSGAYYTPYSYNQDKIANVLLLKFGDNRLNPTTSFSVKNGYFNTSFKEGQLDIQYIALPMDEEGYPLVPDHVSFREALYWYVVYKYLYPKVLNGEVQGQFYQDAYEKWQYYCNQAGAEAMMPDLMTLENIKRSYLSLRLRPNLFDNFYNTLNKNY